MRWRYLRVVGAGVVLCACSPSQAPQTQPQQQAQTQVKAQTRDGIAEVNSIPGPIVETPPPVPPPPIVVAKAEDMPEAQDGQLSVDGWKRIRIGMSLDDLNAALGTHASVAKDADYAEYQCIYLDLPDKTWPSVMYVDGRVARLEVDQPGIATYGGLGVGDNATKARAVFGANLNERARAYTGLPSLFLTVWTKGGPAPERALSPEEQAERSEARGIRFETKDDGTIERFYAGDGSIEWIEGCL